MELSAVIRKEGKLFVAWCPELDIASQGPTTKKALSNLREAVELYLEDPHAHVPKRKAILTTFEAGNGETSRPLRA
ncbi:MAG TPA: type II toxin-antitoxin system HicB family antitoxin [Candidatus Thermoplasmatota archaeon]|nr:type II toxin-antitoxin system HicB family antitoxin [Candidatus Thermoplasmatota archaeon]